MTRNKWAIVGGLMLAIMITWWRLVMYTFTHLPEFKEIIPTLGQVGDAFNIITCLISSLTIIGVLTAVYIQHKELEEARQAQKTQTELDFLSRYFEALAVSRQTKPLKFAADDEQAESARINRITDIFETRANEILCSELLRVLKSSTRPKHLYGLIDELNEVWNTYGDNIPVNGPMLSAIARKQRRQVNMLLGTADERVTMPGQFALDSYDKIDAESNHSLQLMAKGETNLLERQVETITNEWTHLIGLLKHLAKTFEYIDHQESTVSPTLFSRMLNRLKNKKATG